MKSFKILAMGTMALAAAAMASAATVNVKIIGSSAFRAASTVAAYNLLDGTKSITGSWAESGKSMTGATRTVLVGTRTGTSDTYVIQMFWTGSAGGVLSIASGANGATPAVLETAAWLSASNVTTAVTKTGSGLTQTLGGGNYAGATPAFDAAAQADIAMSDSHQATTAYTVDAGYPDLLEKKVGVIPFLWVRGASTDSAVTSALANFTNISPLQAQQMLVNGLPLSQFTNVAADSGTKVFPLGRDADSGTRIAAFAESGFGVFSNPAQYKTTDNGTNVTGIALYPAQSINGVSYLAGQGGYAGGSDLAGPLNKPVLSGTTFGGKNVVLVGYVGANDAAGVTTGTKLAWNGVSLPFNSGGGLTDGKWNFDAIRNGSYTFWTYEWVMLNTNIHTDYTSDAQGVFANALAAQIQGGDAAVSGVALSSMLVSRNNEGTVVY